MCFNIIGMFNEDSVFGMEGSNLTMQRLLEESSDTNFIFHNGDISCTPYIHILTLIDAMGNARLWENWFAKMEPITTHIPYMVNKANEIIYRFKG